MLSFRPGFRPLRSLNLRRFYSKTPETSITITDPLIIYQSMVSRGLLRPDTSQFRVAVEFQKLYHRVKDYTPEEDIQIKIRQLVREIESKQVQNNQVKVKPTWYKRDSNTHSLVKILSDEEELTNFKSPHGLLLNGEVGCGKSMLMDIFAKSLPHQSKTRWHYSNFMLWVYNEIHLIYERRTKTQKFSKHSLMSLENEFILFEIAQKMIRKNTILLLDEFMLPDLAAAKIVKLLFTYFFKLGGVLVATSNRLPEDLYATDFKKSDFRSFLRVLEARCYSLDMNSDNDYRAILSESSKDLPSYLVVGNDETALTKWNQLLKTEANVDLAKDDIVNDKVTVYGRNLQVPLTANGVVYFKFEDICKGLYGPGDYISLASNYHTFIIEDVPVLKLSMKNEARRFITLIDALYESKCKVFVQTEVDPAELFFPDTNAVEEEANRIRVQEEEMFSKTTIALTAPYRPNTSYYDDEKIVYTETENEKTIKNIELTEENYSNSKAFTGEDEKFAYKRAVSRLREMTGSGVWRMDGKWDPIDKTMRPWEITKDKQLEKVSKEFEQLDNELNLLTGRSYNSANADSPNGTDNNTIFAPMFNTVHFWSMGLWGKGNRIKDDIAKKWIKGADRVLD